MAKKPSKRVPPAPKTVTVPYERTADFRTVYADGTLLHLRPDQDDAILSFYIEDFVTTERSGKLRSATTGSATYELDTIIDKSVHSIHTNVRMNIRQALAISRLIVNQVSLVRPDLLEEMKNMIISAGPKPKKAPRSKTRRK